MRERGGLTMAQAAFDEHAMNGMPMNATATGHVDCVLSIEKLPAKLIAYRKLLLSVESHKDAGSPYPAPNAGAARRRGDRLHRAEPNECYARLVSYSVLPHTKCHDDTSRGPIMYDRSAELRGNASGN